MISQPMFTYPGITDYLSVSYTLSHGTQPGKIHVRCVAGMASPAMQGTARLFDPGTGVTVQLPDCRVDSAHVELSPSGEQVIRFEILDQRWRWRLGYISGQYNLRTEAASQIVPGTQKSPRELAQLCLTAMGVTHEDLSRMPNHARPYVDWDITNPAAALAALAETVGCTVVLKTNGRVSLEPTGQGKSLPINGFLLQGRTSYDPPELPLGIELVAGPTRYQVDFELEAVGEDIDGEIKPIDELSYKPKQGWAFETAWTDNVDPRCQELSQQSIFKMYRIKVPDYLPGVAKTRGNRVRSIDEVLPLLSHQLDDDLLPDDTRKRRPPWVYGTYAKGELGSSKPSMQPPSPNLASYPEQRYQRAFTVDYRRGIVRFAEPVFQYIDNGTQQLRKAADLRLRVATCWRRSETRGLEHWSLLRGRKSARENPLVVHRSDIALEVKHDEKTSRVRDNVDELTRQARYYLDQTLAQMRSQPIASAQYVGLQPIEPDGAIRQVTWRIDSEGSLAAKTTASLNCEQLLLDASYQEKRFLERVRQNLHRQQQAQQAKGVQHGQP
ncbi:hypothetical protein C5Y96_10825 [Blastopirellula marina]|uniref:Uncharacterized protein n=1 Tax=Blastopirellula marina TaxID=124 RepID=A0A2S8FMH9_9BACT|nr:MULTISPECIES: hypothetical protein [Pirellulaceae]PQO33337.1 hypothetical protein C5Y96_10825 [Blastopirellula marina]RCS52426.1 hypothetical protein DTL36_10835 [Bremerella cremea]